MKIFLILINFLTLLPASNSQNVEACKVFDDCLEDFVPALSFKDLNYNSDALKFLSISPETWTKICPKSYNIVKCLENSKCQSTDRDHNQLYGVMDMIIYACHQNTKVLTKLHKCPQKDTVEDMFLKCMTTEVNNCLSVQNEFKCVSDLGQKPEYCLTSGEFGEIYSAMFQPRNQVNVQDCEIVSDGCTSLMVRKCAGGLNSFIALFPSALNDEQDTSARFERYCKEIKDGSECFKKNKCFEENAIASYNFKYKWDAADFMCNESPLEIKKINQCHKSDVFFGLKLDDCKKIPNDSQFCKNFLESKTCTFNVVNSTVNCMDPNIYNGYYSILVDFHHEFFCTSEPKNSTGKLIGSSGLIMLLLILHCYVLSQK